MQSEKIKKCALDIFFSISWRLYSCRITKKVVLIYTYPRKVNAVKLLELTDESDLARYSNLSTPLSLGKMVKQSLAGARPGAK